MKLRDFFYVFYVEVLSIVVTFTPKYLIFLLYKYFYHIFYCFLLAGTNKTDFYNGLICNHSDNSLFF